MAMTCMNGGKICDGCGKCGPQAKLVGYCAHCKEAVYDWEERYDIGDELIHEDCLTGWAEKYRVSL